MPDFPAPSGAGATAAEVWAYATRDLTVKTGFEISGTKTTLDALNDIAQNQILSDATPFPGGNIDQTISQVKADILVEPATDKIDGSQIDASIASRSSHAPGDILLVPAEKIDAVKLDATIVSRAPASEYDTEMAHLDADISTRSSHAPDAIWTEATRTITALTGTPRTDLIGEDASFEAATGRPAKIPRLDNIPAYETPIEATITLTGPATEDELVIKEDNKIGLLDGYVDLTPMAEGDTVVIRQSMQIKAAGDYVMYAQETYTNEQTIKLLHIVTKTAKDKIKVTAERTAGTVTSLDVQFYRRLQA